MTYNNERGFHPATNEEEQKNTSLSHINNEAKAHMSMNAHPILIAYE